MRGRKKNPLLLQARYLLRIVLIAISDIVDDNDGLKKSGKLNSSQFLKSLPKQETAAVCQIGSVIIGNFDTSANTIS